ncbi:MAG: SOS response-associated peptidase [Betaproteobacteria bacterium]
MCSRYFLDADGNIIAYTFRVPANTNVRKRFNIAPTQEAPVIRLDREGRPEVALLRWGLVPFWAKDLKAGHKMINARCEGIEAKPAFREAVQARRCIVPASGFFEWKGVPGHKQPFAITLPDEPLFGLAGLWERWKRGEHDYVETFTIVTTDANEAVAPIHDRMPAIVPKAAVDAWLRGPAEEACRLLKPYAGRMDLRAVRKAVNDPKVEGPECLEDAEPSWEEDRQRPLL